VGGYAPESVNDKKRKRKILKGIISARYMLKVDAYAPESRGFSRYLAMLGAYAPESLVRRCF
jgi:negative regulator of replication initiation